MESKQKKKLYVNIILLTLAAIICGEIIIHTMPLTGAIKSDLKDYGSYPIAEIILNNSQNSIPNEKSTAAFHYQWKKGNLIQATDISLSFDTEGNGYKILSSDQVGVNSKGLFFRHVGSAVNIIDDVIYIQITGYRKTLFVTGGAEQFGFALRVIRG